MSLAKRIQSDLVDAMRSRDRFAMGALRMIKAAFKNSEVERRRLLSEEEERGVLTTLLKQRLDSAAQFRQGDRPELADREEREAALIRDYLPSPATEEEIDLAVTRAIAETGAENMRDMGRVMKTALALMSSRTVDPGRVSALVRARLQS